MSAKNKTENPFSLTVMRSAAGSAPSVSQYKYMRQLGARVVAIDSSPLSVGFYFADAAYHVPSANDPTYVDTLLSICEKEKVNIFLPALDEELLLLSESRARFEEIGVKVLISSSETLAICTDKLATYNFFLEHDIPTVPTFTPEQAAKSPLKYPVVVKPRSGRGSTNVFIARNGDEAAFFMRYVERAVVQTFIQGVEYTIDVLADNHYNPLIISPRRRLATDSGISSKGITARNPLISSLTAYLVRQLKLVGPANIQCFLTENGEIYFSEINARLAGTVMLSVAAGVPIFEGIFALARGESFANYRQPVEERIMLRYWEECYVSPNEATAHGWEGV